MDGFPFFPASNKILALPFIIYQPGKIFDSCQKIKRKPEWITRWLTDHQVDTMLDCTASATGQTVSHRLRPSNVSTCYIIFNAHTESPVDTEYEG